MLSSSCCFANKKMRWPGFLWVSPFHHSITRDLPVPASQGFERYYKNKKGQGQPEKPEKPEKPKETGRCPRGTMGVFMDDFMWTFRWWMPIDQSAWVSQVWEAAPIDNSGGGVGPHIWYFVSYVSSVDWVRVELGLPNFETIFGGWLTITPSAWSSDSTVSTWFKSRPWNPTTYL